MHLIFVVFIIFFALRRLILKLQINATHLKTYSLHYSGWYLLHCNNKHLSNKSIHIFWYAASLIIAPLWQGSWIGKMMHKPDVCMFAATISLTWLYCSKNMRTHVFPAVFKYIYSTRSFTSAKYPFMMAFKIIVATAMLLCFTMCQSCPFAQQNKMFGSKGKMTEIQQGCY